MIFLLCQGLGWRALPAHYGSWNTVFVRFNRYAKADVWERLFEALAPQVIAELQIDSTTVKAHRHASGAAKKGGPQVLGRSRGGLSTKVHLAICGTSGQIVRFILSAGQRADCLFGPLLAAGLRPRALVADRAYDTKAMIHVASASDAVLVVPSRRRRKRPRALYTPVYRRRNIVERIIGRLKDHRRIATRFDKKDQNFRAFLCIAAALFNLNPTVNTA